MQATQAFKPSPAQARQDAPAGRQAQADDKAMLRAAAELTRDLAEARAAIYWPDMLGSAAIGYGALVAAILIRNGPVSVALVVVAILALYRAQLFIHEITHLHRHAIPGFRTAWNVIVGIPAFTPSLMYEGVHTLHHARTRYGTAQDPEYMPLALMRPWSLPAFVAVAALLPLGLLVRWAVLAPLGLVIPAVRRISWERFSSLSINPAFRRRPPEQADRARFAWQEAGASVWAMIVLSSPLWLGWRPLLIVLAVSSGVAVINQLRTLAAHLWENEGEAISVTAQYLDSVNVPTQLGALWAPVGLRYHALHHLLPGLPYHALPEAHRRLSEHLGARSTYAKASHTGLVALLARLGRKTMHAKGTGQVKGTGRDIG